MYLFAYRHSSNKKLNVVIVVFSHQQIRKWDINYVLCVWKKLLSLLEKINICLN